MLHCAPSQAPIKPPWSKVMQSPALWAIIAAHTANDWGFFALTVVIPSYLNHILKYELKVRILAYILINNYYN